MATNHQDLFQAIVDTIESTVDGLHESTHILSPRQTPGTTLHRSFSLDIQTTNTRKYRDRPDRAARLESLCVVRVVYALNPKKHQATQRISYRDEQNVIVALMTDLRSPLDQVRTRFIRTVRTMDPKLEWLYNDIQFGFEFDFQLNQEILT